MEAYAGDHLVVEGAKVGQARRTCEVLRVEGPADHRRFWVRWEDGHESLFVPGSDAHVDTAGSPMR